MVNIFAIALLYSGDTILLARRCNADFGDGLYHMVGGRVEQGETARHAVKREVLEETGLDIAEDQFTLVHTLHRKGTEHELVVLCFEADVYRMNAPRIMEPHKHDDMQFFAKDDLPDNIIPAHRQAIYCVQHGITYSEHGWDGEESAPHKEVIAHFCSDQMQHPFNYDLGIKLIKSDDERENYLLCCHGSGANNRIADDVKSYNATRDHIIGFNFPDHDKDSLDDDPRKTTFGSIEELLPALYMLKNLVIDGNLSKINLYGFSAGGGVIINLLAVLSNNRFEQQLRSVGVTDTNRQKILAAIERGIVILDCPLRSIDEIIDFRGGSNKALDYLLHTYAQRYRDNDLRPIDSLQTWKDMHLTIVLYLELPDEKLSNRDDTIFADLVKKHNAGSTHVVYGYNNGHCGKHDALWSRAKLA